MATSSDAVLKYLFRMDLHEKKNETNTFTATFEFSALKLNDISIEVYPGCLTVFGEINLTES